MRVKENFYKNNFVFKLSIRLHLLNTKFLSIASKDTEKANNTISMFKYNKQVFFVLKKVCKETNKILRQKSVGKSFNFYNLVKI